MLSQERERERERERGGGRERGGREGGGREGGGRGGGREGGGERVSWQCSVGVMWHVQDDLLYASLTVYETLYYAAMLRLPRTMTRKQKIARVEAVIDTLGLRKCKDTIIGEVLVLLGCSSKLLEHPLLPPVPSPVSPPPSVSHTHTHTHTQRREAPLFMAFSIVNNI
jgi:hypothetical protein